MTDCIFCSIVAGSIPASIVHREDDVLAFMDIHPINPGHVLVIPHAHVPDLHHLDESLFNRVMLTARKLASAIERVYAPKKMGFSVIGFDVPHAHVHVVPLHDYHDLTSKALLEGRLGQVTAQELDENMQKIKNEIRRSP